MLSCYSGEALLPPLWQSIDEIKSMLEQPDLSNYLESADYIENISRIEKGFLITTNKHILEAHIHYLPQDKPGRALFSWTFVLR